MTVTPAVQRVSDSGNSGADVQFVQWGRPYGYRYRGNYGPYYGRGYYAPYYGSPVYGGYGYSYPAYGYGYPGYGFGYGAYGYGYPAYGGIGIRAGGVGVGIWWCPWRNHHCRNGGFFVSVNLSNMNGLFRGRADGSCAVFKSVSAGGTSFSTT